MKNYKANISREEFTARLPRNVVKGQPWVLFTPLGIANIFSSSHKYFYGGYDDQSFSLTKSSFFSPCPFIVKGSYELADDGESAYVSYQVKPLVLPFFISRLLLFATLIAIYKGASLVEFVLNNYEMLLTATIAWCVFTLLLIVISMRKKEELEEIFRSVFVFT